ncbi:LuxR C-terminal-related transcriptional regulator [Ktedonospora formicarum]|uniref:LuxR family transcriptional regulator n=1 Tax=Ktedonospora formicarum TaxID=2778364 RepID=A0A8J3I462_9CHLR|nr:LuxR C-terminal-related transcriptional regulator [Ktedonospora formicarum]GHO48381.1 LuxR family transcriptional regulator [Ktedonospora formicarum]
MPKRTRYLLIWSEETGRYELQERDSNTHTPFQEDEKWWRSWLTQQKSFAFQGRQGHITLLKEARKRGTDYWYAYRSQNRQTSKKYAGRTADLTIALLEELAESFINQTVPHKVGTPEPGLPKVNLKVDLQVEIPHPSPPYETTALEPKFRTPRLQATLVARERLWDRLDMGLQSKLILVCAPAGFGKTTLVSQWLNERCVTTIPVAWLSLDEGDNDPLRFWRSIITACQRFHPHIGHASLALLSPTLSPSLGFQPLETILTSFLNELARNTCTGIIILEEYHLITETRLHETLTFFLNHLPPDMHIIMLTRSRPAFPLVNWQARGELCEIQSAELRFSPEETRSFFQQTLFPSLPIPLSDELLHQINARVEGWAAGLRLLTLSIQSRSQQAKFEHVLKSFAGNQRSLQEYFVTEVLNVQSPKIQHFLLRTSILTTLTASLCDALLGRHDSQLLLEKVEQAGLFLEALDGSEAWYRYHALFAEAMRAEAQHLLDKETYRSLYLKASLWYEQQNLYTEAIETAFQAQDIGRVTILIEHLLETSENFVFGRSIFQRAPEFHTLRRWLEQLPEEVMSAHPLLCLGHAEAILFVAIMRQSAPLPPAMQQLEKALQMAENGWRHSGNQARLGEVLAFRAMVLRQPGAMHEAASYARQALALLPAEAVASRMMSRWFVGMGEQEEGNLNTALEAFLEVQAFCEALGHAPIKRANTVWLSGLYYALGELQQAAESYRQLLDEARLAEDIDDICDALLGLAQLSYEWNELATAEQQARDAFDLAQQLNNSELQVQATLILAHVELAYGDFSVAQRRCIAQLTSLPAALPQRSRLMRELQAMQAQLALAQDDFVAFERIWGNLTPVHELPHSQRNRETLLQARWLLRQDQAEAALDLLETMLPQAQLEGRTGTVWEIQLCMTLTHAALKHLPTARQQLQSLLTHIHAAGYIRLFLNEGEPLAALLQSLLPIVRGGAQRAMLKRLLHAFAQQRSTTESESLLLEPLSTQEQRVLHLLASGHSNPDIARRLTVSVNTVKVQVQSIYRKLKVNNRVEASEVARTLNLLS